MLKSILNSLVWWPLPTRLLNTAHIKERLSHFSPITWQHVNFYGRYEFSTMAESVDLQALVEELSSKHLPFFD